MDNLDIYNELREFHDTIHNLQECKMSNHKVNALEALNSVLYMAESEFAKDGELTAGNRITVTPKEEPHDELAIRINKLLQDNGEDLGRDMGFYLVDNIKDYLK